MRDITAVIRTCVSETSPGTTSRHGSHCPVLALVVASLPLPGLRPAPPYGSDRLPYGDVRPPQEPALLGRTRLCQGARLWPTTRMCITAYLDLGVRRCSVASCCCGPCWQSARPRSRVLLFKGCTKTPCNSLLAASNLPT